MHGGRFAGDPGSSSHNASSGTILRTAYMKGFFEIFEIPEGTNRTYEY
jgi:hypothetical protein